MVDGTREKSSADQLLQKLGVVTTNAWEGERDREGGRLAQCNDCDGSQRSHHLVDTCFWTAALAFGPTSLLINIWWNKWWIFYDFFPFKFKLLWNTGAQKKKKKDRNRYLYQEQSLYLLQHKSLLGEAEGPGRTSCGGGRRSAVHHHAVTQHLLGSGPPIPLSSSTFGRTLMNYKNSSRGFGKSPQLHLEAWTVAQEVSTWFQRTAGRIILLMLGVPLLIQRDA